MDSAASTRMRPEIELAWRRATVAGLDPGMEVHPHAPAEVQRRGRLVVAATPVLDRMADELSGEPFSVLLADRDSVIVDRRYGSRSLVPALDRVMAVPGSRYTETVSGTNALATAFELRRPIAVSGREHFLEALHQFGCYGAPIVHPATRRLEGVLDVTGRAGQGSPLLASFVMRAVGDIEQQLLDGSRAAQRHMLAAFQASAVGRPHPVVVVGADLFLANPPAVDLLRAADHATLRELAGAVTASGTRRTTVELESGTRVRVHFARVPDSPEAVLFEFEVDRQPARATPAPRRSSRPPAAAGPRLVCGEPGSGRTRRARELAGAGAVVVDAAEELECGPADWLRRVRGLVRAGTPLVVDDVDLLSDQAAGLLAKLLDDPATSGRVVLVGGPDTVADPARAALVARCPVREDLPALRHRPEPFAALVRDLLAELPGTAGRALTPSALQVLAAHPWPGHLAELRRVLQIAFARRSSGDVTVADLPVGYRISPQRRRFDVLEQAEHDAIVRVLGQESGNKARAAARLGIGRNTLYERIRRLGIPT